MSTELQKKTGRPADTAKREAIIDAATHAFFAQGFAASSIEQIAADAGVSKVTVYNHFGDKRALFTAAVEAQCASLRSHFSIEDLPQGSLRERLINVGEAMVAFLSRPEMVQFERRIAAETEQDPEIGATFLAAGPHRMMQTFTQFIQAMVDAGELVVQDHQLAAEQFASMCKGMGDLERRFGCANDLARNRLRIEGAVDLFCNTYATRIG